MVSRVRPSPVRMPLSRRRLLRAGALGAVGLLASPGLVLAGSPGLNAHGTKVLAFHSLHTGETVEAAFWLDGAPVPEGLREIDHALRDHRNGEVKEIDVNLLHLLHSLKDKLGARQPFNLISGYRSPATNAMLRKTGNGVAKKSYHMRGMAVDVALPGFELKALRRAAIELKGGGVGYYPKPGFIHVDTGPPRQWS